MNEYPKILFVEGREAIALNADDEQGLRDSGFVDFADLDTDDEQVAESLTKAQIIEHLTAANVDHNPRASKADLQALLPE